MELNVFDVTVFIAFIVCVVGFSMYKSRSEKSSEDFFLASRGLKWWLIGFSIVAANISTEQFVGMAGSGAGNVGLAVSGYQLLGAVTILNPLHDPKVMPVREDYDMRPSRSVLVLGSLVILAVAAFYIIFR